MKYFLSCCSAPVPPQITLSTYVTRRLGNDTRSQAVNFLAKPFGAVSFAQFWWYWNPVFGYYLYYYSYKPLRVFLPRWVSIWITFLFCGMLHDLPFGLAAVLSGTRPPTFTLTIMFVFLGMIVVVTERAKLRLDHIPFTLRWPIHVLALFLCWYVAGSFTSITS